MLNFSIIRVECIVCCLVLIVTTVFYSAICAVTQCAYSFISAWFQGSSLSCVNKIFVN